MTNPSHLNPSHLDQLIELINELRDPLHGCPWSLAQTMESILPLTIEEVYEFSEAIAEGKEDQIKNELADLLYHVLFYAHLAAEEKRFNLDDLAKLMLDKQQRRRPPKSDYHKFTPEEMNAYWQKQKSKKVPRGILDNIPSTQPAIQQSLAYQKRAALVGFDWHDINDIFDKLDEEIAELRDAINQAHSPDAIELELGDIQFCILNLARHLNLDPELALRKSNKKFADRLHYMETRALESGKRLDTLNDAELDLLWNEAKGSFPENDSS